MQHYNAPKQRNHPTTVSPAYPLPGALRLATAEQSSQHTHVKKTTPSLAFFHHTISFSRLTTVQRATVTHQNLRPRPALSVAKLSPRSSGGLRLLHCFISNVREHAGTCKKSKHLSLLRATPILAQSLLAARLQYLYIEWPDRPEPKMVGLNPANRPGREARYPSGLTKWVFERINCPQGAAIDF